MADLNTHVRIQIMRKTNEGTEALDIIKEILRGAARYAGASFCDTYTVGGISLSLNGHPNVYQQGDLNTICIEFDLDPYVDLAQVPKFETALAQEYLNAELEYVKFLKHLDFAIKHGHVEVSHNG